MFRRILIFPKKTESNSHFSLTLQIVFLRWRIIFHENPERNEYSHSFKVDHQVTLVRLLPISDIANDLNDNGIIRTMVVIEYSNDRITNSNGYVLFPK